MDPEKGGLIEQIRPPFCIGNKCKARNASKWNGFELHFGSPCIRVRKACVDLT
jgi:hypothetical protein